LLSRRLRAFSEEQLREIPNLGPTSVADISAAFGDPALGSDDLIELLSPAICERDQELIGMRQQGATLAQLARRFGISKTRVEQVLERDGW
jgi:hypothetical protein